MGVGILKWKPQIAPFKGTEKNHQERAEQKGMFGSKLVQPRHVTNKISSAWRWIQCFTCRLVSFSQSNLGQLIHSMGVLREDRSREGGEERSRNQSHPKAKTSSHQCILWLIKHCETDLLGDSAVQHDVFSMEKNLSSQGHTRHAQIWK